MTTRFKQPIFGDLPYVSQGRWPGAEHLEEFATRTGHSVTIDHSRGETIEAKYAELQQRLEAARPDRRSLTLKTNTRSGES